MLAAAATMLVPPLNTKLLGEDSEAEPDELQAPPPNSPTTEVAPLPSSVPFY